tara:strand:+ start:71 stop:1312 length:1242 start_codon:yes stop_codon:yes gene_type:complete
MKITKNQLKQIVQEEMAAVIREGYVEDFGKGVGYVTDKVVNAPAKIGRAVKKVGSDFLSGFDSQTDVRVPASGRVNSAEEWAKTADPNDGSPRWADPAYADAYDALRDNRRQAALDSIPDRDDATYDYPGGGDPRQTSSLLPEWKNNMKITKRQLQQIIQEELAQVVSERERTESELFPGTFTYAAKKPSAAAAPDLRTSEPALPDEQYPTSPGEYGGNDRMMTSIPPTPLDGTPEQNAYARKLFGMPEPAAPAAPAAKQGDAFMASRGLANEFPDAPTVFQGKKGDPYEYKEVNGQYQARRKGSDKWNSIKKGSKAAASIASVQKGGPSLYRRPKAPAAKPVDAAPAQKPAAPATPAVAAAPVGAKQQKRNQMADAFEKAQRAKDGKGTLTPKAQAKATKIRKRGKKLNPFD